MTTGQQPEHIVIKKETIDIEFEPLPTQCQGQQTATVKVELDVVSVTTQPVDEDSIKEEIVIEVGPTQFLPQDQTSEKWKQAQFESNEKNSRYSSSSDDHKQENPTSNLKKKTRAQYQREYRLRLKYKTTPTQTQISSEQKKRKAANSKAYRQRKKLLREEGDLVQKCSTQESSVLQPQRKWKRAQFELNENNSTYNSSSDNHKQENPTSNLRKKTRAQYQREYRLRLKGRTGPMQTQISDGQKVRQAANSKAYRERKKLLREEGVLVQKCSTQESSVLQSQRENPFENVAMIEEARTQVPNENEQIEQVAITNKPVTGIEQQRVPQCKVEPGTSESNLSLEYNAPLISSNECNINLELKQYLYTHAAEKPFACQLCSYRCKTESKMVKHMRVHTGEKPFACQLCSYRCKAKSKMVRHMGIHTGEKPFACELCSFKCAVKIMLVRHMCTHTGDKPFACSLCSYKCIHKGTLVRHMRTHSGDKPFACDLCSYKCIEKSILIKHMRTHTGEKPFACKLCSYKCNVKGALTRHMSIHSEVKPFACELCSYRFKKKCYMIGHMLTHTGENPFACDLCSYKCKRKDTLVKHMHTHTGEKPFACD